MESFPWLLTGKLPPSVANKIVLLSPSGCWEWGAAKNNGYGVVQWNGKICRAHRVVYELLVGPIPEGLETDHLCRNRGCVNPAHLEPVPGAVNNARGESRSAKNMRKTHCKRGHPFSSDNTYLVARQRRGGRSERVCRECCRNGRDNPEPAARGTEHHNVRLTEEDVREIRRVNAAGESMGSLSRRYGVNVSQIHKIVHRKAWRHIGEDEAVS